MSGGQLPAAGEGSTARRMCPWSPSMTSEGEVKRTGAAQRETAVGHQRAVTWGLQNAPRHRVAWRTPKRCRSPALPGPPPRGSPGAWTARRGLEAPVGCRRLTGSPPTRRSAAPPVAGAMEQKRRWWIIYKPLAAPHGCLAESHHRSRPRRARPGNGPRCHSVPHSGTAPPTNSPAQVLTGQSAWGPSGQARRAGRWLPACR